VVEDENVEDENWDTLPMTPPNLRNQISLSMKSFCADPLIPHFVESTFMWVHHSTVSDSPTT
jgi:hypothetical protein